MSSRALRRALLPAAVVLSALSAVLPPAAVAAAEPAGAGRLSGLIQDTTGKPFAAAEVVVSDIRSGGVVASGRSDSAGRYDLAVADGRYDITVAAPTSSGERRASVDDVEVDGDTKLNVAIVGQPTRSVGFRGTVRDGDGLPVPFATVSAGGTTVADPDGRFDFETPAGEYELKVVRPLPRGSRITVETPGFKLADHRELDVAIKTVELTVQVRDYTGRAVPGVDVSAWSDENCEACTGAFKVAGLRTYRRSSVRATTDSNGIARLEVLPATSATIGVDPPYRSGLPSARRQGVHIAGDMHYDMVVGWNTASDSRFATAAASPAPARLTGTARTRDGAPLAGADLSLHAGGDLVFSDDVSEDGSFSVDAPPGRYTLRFSGPEADDDWDYGYEPEHDAYSITIPNFDLSADTPRDLVIPASAVAVRVLDPAGVPVPDAWVRSDNGGAAVQFGVTPGLTGSGTVSSYWHTGVDGIARIRMLPGAAARVSIEPPGGRGLPTSVTVPAGTTGTRDVRLDWGPTLRGHVRTSAGEPTGLSDDARLSGDGFSSRITMGPDGTYAVTAEPGRYGISIDPPEEFHTPSSSWGWSSLWTEQTIELTADRTLDLVMPDDRQTTVSAVDVAGRPAGEWDEDFSGSSVENIQLAPGLEASTAFGTHGPGSSGDTTTVPAQAPSAINGDLEYPGNKSYEIDGAVVFPGERNVFAAAFGTTLPTPDTPTAYAGPGATPGTIVAGWSPVVSDAEITAYIVVPDGDFSAAAWVPAPAATGELRGLTPDSLHSVSVYALSRYGVSDATDVVARAMYGGLPADGDGANNAGGSGGGDNTGGTGGGNSAGGSVGVSGATNTPKSGSGYWLLADDGAVAAFGTAGEITPGSPLPASVTAVDLEPTPARDGYWILGSDGSVRAAGAAVDFGSLERSRLASGERPTSLSATPSGKGYWVFTDRGRVVPFGDAQSFGDMTGTKLNGPVLDSVATPTGRGYYLVASDGGIFAFGDAAFAGSMGGTRLNAPVRSLVPDPDGSGYWLVASDGGIFAFDAGFRGSMGGTRLNRPVTGMVPYGNGYLMVAEDGGVFNFSDLPFAGSLGSRPPTRPIISVASAAR